ncbi:MAG: hypothetical protein WAN58_11845 [Anaerolineales bacterium]
MNNIIASPERSEWAWQSQLTFKQEIAASVSDLLAMTTRIQKEMDEKLMEWEELQK